MPEWEALLSLEKDFREESILNLIRVPVADPARAEKTAYWKGRIDALSGLVELRDRLRKQSKGKGGKYANHEKQEEDTD